MKNSSTLYVVSEEHLCAFEGCMNVVPYASEPYCFMHSPDDGYVEEYN